jgi:hypothetical protein
MAITTETIPFDFDDLYNGLKTKFDEKGYDTAEGSNTSQLITAMAYLTSMLNVNTAVNINETLLPLATKRKTALRDARVLGYETSHIQSYQYKIRLVFAAGDHVIPKFAKFSTGGKDYYYMGERIDLVDVNLGHTLDISVKEGKINKFSDNPNTLRITTGTTTNSEGIETADYYIDIPYVNVEANGIEVFVTYYDDLGNLIEQEEWNKSEQFMIDADSILDREYIRLDDLDYNTPRIYFQLAGVGEGIRAGSIVEMNVLTSNGTSGGIDDISTAILTHDIGDPGIAVQEILSLEAQGADEETLESIKLNAPMFHNSANRAVTKNDYVAICNKQAAVKSSMVWGGDDEFPKIPGHIWFSFLPSTNLRSFVSDEFKTNYSLVNPTSLENWYIEDEEIRSTVYIDGVNQNPGVWDVLEDYKIPTLSFQNRHPLFLDFDYDVNILKYNVKTSKADIHQQVFNVIDNFFTGSSDSIKTEDFEVEYFHSNLEKRIDTNITDLSGFNNTLNTTLMITSKNISKEGTNLNNNDLYIPLSVPYEKYFNNAGELVTSVLPTIDTVDFISEKGLNLYTDWSGVSGDVSQNKMIIAPVRLSNSESTTITTPTFNYILTNTTFGPDFTDADPGSYTYDLFTVTVNDVVQVYGVDFTVSNNVLQFTNSLQTNDVLNVTANSHVGYYQLFNSYKKTIIVHLYVNGSNVDNDADSPRQLFAEPAYYLTTTDGFYGFTSDSYYITTEAYALTDETAVTPLTGTIVRQVVPELYSLSPLYTEMFDTIRYMNFDYASPNFKVSQNVIPRLKTVEFS